MPVAPIECVHGKEGRNYAKFLQRIELIDAAGLTVDQHGATVAATVFSRCRANRSDQQVDGCVAIAMDSNLPVFLKCEIDGFDRTKGSIHFTSARPLPPAVLDDLIRARVADLQEGG